MPSSDTAGLSGTALRALRLAAGLDQIACAKALGISQAHLSRIENGRGDLADDAWLRASGSLAVGSPRENEPAPRYLVGRERGPGEVALLADRELTVPLFDDPETVLLAVAVLDLFRVAGVCAIPVWTSFTDEIEAAAIRLESVALKDGSDLDALPIATRLIEALDHGPWPDPPARVRGQAPKRDSEADTPNRPHRKSRAGALRLVGPRGEKLWPPKPQATPPPKTDNRPQEGGASTR